MKITKTIFFSVVIFYSCSFVSANAIEGTALKKLPLYLLLGTAQFSNVICKSLASGAHNTSAIVSTEAANITNITKNIFTEIAKIIFLQQQMQKEIDAQDIQTDNLNNEVVVLDSYLNYVGYKQQGIETSFDIFRLTSVFLFIVIGVSVVYLCWRPRSQTSSSGEQGYKSIKKNITI